MSDHRHAYRYGSWKKASEVKYELLNPRLNYMFHYLKRYINTKVSSPGVADGQGHQLHGSDVRSDADGAISVQLSIPSSSSTLNSERAIFYQQRRSACLLTVT